MGGFFVSLEGIDRAGKSTQAALLCGALGARAVCVREPGGTEVGERVRELLVDPGFECAGETEALLFAAARAELVARLVRPALEEGRIVVADRFVDSSFAYQGDVRGLGVGEVAALNRFATAGLLPDLTVLLEIDPDEAAARAGDVDRFEREGRSFQQRVARAYERLAAAEPGRFVRVAAGRAEDDVHADVLAHVERALAVAG